MNKRALIVGLCGAVLVAALSIVTRSAQAQIIPKSVEIDAFGSFYSFVARGGFSQDETVKLENFQDGLMLGGRFGVNFTEVIGFESTMGVLRGATDDTLRRAWYFNLHVDAIFHLPFPYVVPYFVVGAGFQHYNIRPEYARGVGPADFSDGVYYRDPYPDESRATSQYLTYRSADGDFLVDAGGGAKFLIYEKLETSAGFAVGARLDIRWKLSIGASTAEDGIPTLAVTTDSNGDPVVEEYRGVFNHLELGGGVFFLFGGGIGPDRDKDGIPNRKDECPDEPEDKDDFEDDDGCPDADNDKDGIVDADDDCPLEAEDKDTWEDLDGCPDIDNDSDGFFDADDDCPLDAEDKDGFEDRDGCPELDNDGDGFLDPDDRCPTASEVFNSYLDSDGCPDEVPSDLIEFAGAIPAIQFQAGSARLKRTALPILNKASRALRKYPDLHVEIAGHASSEGTSEFNLSLSQSRTQTVRDYLIDKGIAPERLTARGYGETRPVGDNDSEMGRIANRRVEFKLDKMETLDAAGDEYDEYDEYDEVE
jgi:outer membrane protein OmpA-like peptidoglycan-associated protein